MTTTTYTSALSATLETVRANVPLVHTITNYVTVNDCANALLACGGSPIMSDEPEDVADITSICGALVLNIGTLNAHSIQGMRVAGARAGELGHPIVLDPVGAGASALRTATAVELLDTLPVTVVRGNMAVIMARASGASSTRGVEVRPADAVTPENMAESVAFVQDFACKTGAVVAVTGAIDIVADANRAFVINNGTPLMGKITGAGCMLTCVCAAYAAANADQVLEAVAAAVAGMGIAGEIAQSRMTPFDGNASFRTYVIDALYNMDAETLASSAKVNLLTAE